MKVREREEVRDGGRERGGERGREREGAVEPKLGGVVERTLAAVVGIFLTFTHPFSFVFVFFPD